MKKVTLALLFALCLSLLAACGGPSAEEQAKVAETEFLMGRWEATTAEYNGEVKDAKDVIGGLFALYFDEDGTCTMFVDTNRAIVDWAMNDDGSLTLTGDGAYDVTFPDDSKDTLVIVINDINVTMEKDDGA